MSEKVTLGFSDKSCSCEYENICHLPDFDSRNCKLLALLIEFANWKIKKEIPRQ